MCKVLPSRDAHLSLGVQGFYWESVTQAGSTHVTDLGYADASPTGQEQAFIVSHNVRINNVVTLVQHGPGPQAYIALSGRIFQDSGEVKGIAY